MDSPRPPALAMLRVTTAVLELGQLAAAGDEDAAAAAAALAELLEGYGPADAERGTVPRRARSLAVLNFYHSGSRPVPLHEVLNSAQSDQVPEDTR